MQWGVDVKKGDKTLLAEALEKMTKEADVSGTCIHFSRLPGPDIEE
jgi:hypothetical protein